MSEPQNATCEFCGTVRDAAIMKHFKCSVWRTEGNVMRLNVSTHVVCGKDCGLKLQTHKRQELG